MAVRVIVSAAELSLAADGSARVSSNQFLNALVQEAGSVLTLIQSTAPSVRLDEISIDSNGVIHIANQEFAVLVRDIVCNPVGAVGNAVCGLVC